MYIGQCLAEGHFALCIKVIVYSFTRLWVMTLETMAKLGLSEDDGLDDGSVW